MRSTERRFRGGAVGLTWKRGCVTGAVKEKDVMRMNGALDCGAGGRRECGAGGWMVYGLARGFPIRLPM